MKKMILPVLILVLGLVFTGCQAAPIFISGSPSLTLTIDQIVPDGNPGQYALQGQTSLPDGTEFVVSAVRSLSSASPEVNFSEEAIYGTLARGTAIAEAGRWQTRLNLWQPSSAGTYQEIWQIQEPFASLDLVPSQDVFFAVTLSPSAFAQSKQDNLTDLKRLGDNPNFNVTPTGEPYLEARKPVTVPFPNGNLTATVSSLSPSESPWADRTNSNQTDTSFSREQELPFAENDNLPVTDSQSLR